MMYEAETDFGKWYVAANHLNKGVLCAQCIAEKRLPAQTQSPFGISLRLHRRR